MVISLEKFQEEIYKKAKNAKAINQFLAFKIVKQNYCESAQPKGLCPLECTECYAFLQEQLDFEGIHNPGGVLVQRMRTGICILQEQNSEKKKPLPDGFVDDHTIGQLAKTFLNSIK